MIQGKLRILSEFHEQILYRLIQEIQDKVDSYLHESSDRLPAMEYQIETIVTRYKLSSYLPIALDDNDETYILSGFDVDRDPDMPSVVVVTATWDKT